MCHLPPGAGRPQCLQRANCDGCAYLRLWLTLSSPGRGRAPTVFNGWPRVNCVGCAYPRPAFSQCVAGLSGKGAHSVGQGLTVTAAPTSGQWLTPSLLVHRGRAPTVLGPVGQGLTVTAAPTPDSDLLSPRWAQSRAHTVSTKG